MLFKNITKAICGNYHLQRNIENQSAISIIDFAATYFPPLESQSVLTLLSSGTKRLDLLEPKPTKPDGFIYLKPTFDKVAIVPIMAFKYNIDDTRDIAAASIGLALLLRDGNTGNPKAIGYRYESGDGKHNYCHIQHIRYFNDDYQLPTEGWIPDSSPTIPIDAGGPVGLLLCVLGSLYGTKYVDQLAGKVDLRRVRHSIEHMRSRSCFHQNLPRMADPNV